MESVTDRADVREVTKKTYRSVMRTILADHTDHKGKLDLSKWFKAATAQNLNIHTKRKQFATILVFLKLLEDKEKEKYVSGMGVLIDIVSKFKEINNDVHETYVQQKMTDTEKEKWVQWPAVEKVWVKNMVIPIIPKDYDAETLYSAQMYSLIGLYTVIPPVRNDYRTVALDMKKPNRIQVKKGGLIDIELTEYKTSKRYGTITVPIDPTLGAKHKLLAAALGNLVKARKEMGHIYLFCDKKGNQLSSTNYSQIITGFYMKALKKPLGSQMLRKIYLSHLQRNDATLVEKRNTAAAMGHSTNMQALYRRLPNDDAS